MSKKINTGFEGTKFDKFILYSVGIAIAFGIFFWILTGIFDDNEDYKYDSNDYDFDGDVDYDDAVRKLDKLLEDE